MTEDVHTIVFWSKNFGPFLKGKFGESLVSMGYNLYFHFTLNSDDRILEPNLPSLKDRLRQLELMTKRFSPKNLNWRFDPLCFYKKDEMLKNNLGDFSLIAETAACCGIEKCTISFMDHYSKIAERISAWKRLEFFDPSMPQKIKIALRMEKILSKKGIRLSACCENELIEGLPPESGIRKSSCVPNDLFVREFGGSLSTSRDRGQRIKQGCGCKVSVDVGVYHLHPCFHDCLFCYANPKPTNRRNICGAK